VAPPKWDIPDRELYRPAFCPWLAKGEFDNFYEIARPNTIVGRESCYVLYILLKQAMQVEGDAWECGVYKGGTAALLAEVVRAYSAEKKLYLFDTFEGMPATDPKRDLHHKGDFADTSVEAVSAVIPGLERCVVRKGFMPASFAGLEETRICFAHLDVDIYQSIHDCLDFIWPRLARGGFIVFDDYGLPSCPGARAAVDEFFRGKPAVPLCLQTAQCLVFKS
jgi:O-methyltransferase